LGLGLQWQAPREPGKEKGTDKRSNLKALAFEFLHSCFPPAIQAHMPYKSAEKPARPGVIIGVPLVFALKTHKHTHTHTYTHTRIRTHIHT
jgi:hypothetical protein